MIKKKVAAMLIFLSLLLACTTGVYASGSDIDFGVELSAESAYVVNMDTGKVVYSKNENAKMAPASCTKIMTCALAMELCDDLDGTIVTVPYGIWNEFDGVDISNAGLEGGEELTMRQLIACMLVQSANEAASVVADYYGRDNFISLMNSKAKELGCTGTHFSNPHGLDEDDHYTTAKDLYIITKWALEKEGFLEMCSCSRYTLAETNEHEERELVTTNKMQEPTSGYYTSYIKGVKTGTTDEAGRCLVSTAQQDGVTYLSVLLGCPYESDARFWDEGLSSYTDARLLYDWCFDNLEVSEVTESGSPITEISLKYAKDKDYILAYSSGTVSTLLDLNNEEEVEIEFDTHVPDFVEAPLEEGAVLGTADVYCDGVLIGTVGLVSRESVERSYFFYFMDLLSKVFNSTVAHVIYAFLFLFLIVYMYYVLYVIPRKEKAAKARRKKNQQM